MARTSPRRPSVREVTHSGVRWVDVDEPATATLKQVLRGLDVHPLDIEDILSPAQRPKLERRPGYLFIVTRFARTTPSQRVRASEIDAVLFDKTLMTFHGHDVPLIRDIFSDISLLESKRAAFFEFGADYAPYEVLRRLLESGYVATDQISRRLDALEADIYERHTRKTTFDVADQRRVITDLRKIALPQSGFLRDVGEAVTTFAGPTTQPYWRSLRQIADSQWEVLEGARETIESLGDTNSTLVGLRLNETFRLLTIISAIFLPASFVINLFGVNLRGVPFINVENGFLIMLGLVFVAEIVFIWILRRLKVL